MANNANSLLSQLSQSKKGARLIGGNTTITNLVVPLSSGNSSSKASALGRLSDIKAPSINGSTEAKGIQFGSPSSRSTSTTTQSGWSNVLTQVATNGAASAFGGALGSIGGIGSLISGIFHLFGGSSNSTATLPPLVRFQLPTSQTETAYIGSQSRNVLQGAATEQPTRTSAQPIYAASSTQKSVSSAPPTVYDTATITQAVKQALLNSSSLNDVIAEI